MDFKTIQALTADDMAKVNETIQAQLNSDVSLINQLGFYIVSGGGKRLRPLLAILSARALGYQRHWPYDGSGVYRVHPYSNFAAR